MDIYKLKDFEAGGKGLVFNEKDNRDERENDRRFDGLVVTGLKAGVKNPERVNVHVNEEFVCSLDVAQVVELKVKVGRVLNEAELTELKRASEYGKLYGRALEWVLMRPRSQREVNDYLCKKVYEKKIDKEYVSKIIGKLEEKGYINDSEFARWWVENRFTRKGVSRKRLTMELAGKGVAKEIIDSVLDTRNDEEEIRKIVAKKRAKYTDEKLMQYLCRQGFSYDLVREVVGGGD